MVFLQLLYEDSLDFMKTCLMSRRPHFIFFQASKCIKNQLSFRFGIGSVIMRGKVVYATAGCMWY
jgi:hypothetical protein